MNEDVAETLRLDGGPHDGGVERDRFGDRAARTPDEPRPRFCG